jgi:hypothetical protein
VVRTAFFVLLFVNLAYFAWANWVDVPPPPPVNQAIEKLPRIKLADELSPAERSQANSSEKRVLNAAAACLSVGPFADADASTRAAALLRARGFDPKERLEEGQKSAGYWVFVGGMKIQGEVDKALVTLEHSGIKDALVMPQTPEGERRLSLGVYSDWARAEKRAEQVREIGLKAEVVERKIPGTLHWVDLTPPAGVTSVPIQDLFSQAVASKIAVQPCPAAAMPPTGTATTSPVPAAQPPARAPNPPAQAEAAMARQLP